MNNLTESSHLEEVARSLGFKKIDLFLYFFGILDSFLQGSKLNLSRKDLFQKFTGYFGLERSIASSFFKDYLSENFVLNQKGFNRIRNIIPRYYGKRRWDGCFYFVSFDIPEELKPKREALRKFLKDRKFGLLHDSVWISVFDYSEDLLRALSRLNIDRSFVNLFKGDVLGATDYKKFANNIWRTEMVNDLYNEFITNFSLAKDLKHSFLGQIQYLAILKEDPQLPEEFLDDSWRAYTANELYQRLVNSFFIELCQ